MTLDLTTPQRQSPLAMVFLGLRILRSLGITQLVILVLFVFRGPFDGPLVVVPSIAILVLGGLSALAWWRYTFHLAGGDLVVDKGVFRTSRLTVPIERIQSITIEQTLFHRVTGLVKVSVDTAGSTGTEFTIDAIARPVAEALQRATVTSGPSTPPAPPRPTSTGVDTTGAPRAVRPDDGHVWPPPMPDRLPDTDRERVVFTHSGRRLLVTALTMWPLAGLVVIGPLLALGESAIEPIVDRLPLFDDLRVDGNSFRWWFVPLGATVFVLLSVLLNTLRVFLQDWRLTLRASPTSLRRTSGLLSRTSTASSVARVQVVSSAQNPLQRRVGLRSVELSNIGEGDLSLPGCDDAQFATVTELGGATPIELLDLTRRIHPAQIWLRVRNASIQAAVVATAAFFVVGWWSTLAFVLVPLVWITQRLHVRNFRWAIGTELATSSRVVDSSTRQALLRKTNTVRITQSIFERRRDLADVHLVTAAGTISVGMLPIAEARAVRDAVLHATETDRRDWM